MKNLKIITCLCVSSMLAAISLSASAQTVDNTFTYQGYLEFQGQAAEGLFDFAISLLDEDAPPAGGAGGNIVDQVLLSDQSVDRGVFTLELDFQDGLFDGTNYWLHVAVREADQPTYTNFGERQKINAVPYVSWALNGGGQVACSNPTATALATRAGALKSAARQRAATRCFKSMRHQLSVRCVSESKAPPE